MNSATKGQAKPRAVTPCDARMNNPRSTLRNRASWPLQVSRRIVAYSVASGVLPPGLAVFGVVFPVAICHPPSFGGNA